MVDSFVKGVFICSLGSGIYWNKSSLCVAEIPVAYHFTFVTGSTKAVDKVLSLVKTSI